MLCLSNGKEKQYKWEYLAKNLILVLLTHHATWIFLNILYFVLNSMVFKNPRNSSLLSGPHSVATQMYGKPKQKYIKICKTLNASSTWDVVRKNYTYFVQMHNTTTSSCRITGNFFLRFNEKKSKNPLNLECQTIPHTCVLFYKRLSFQHQHHTENKLRTS